MSKKSKKVTWFEKTSDAPYDRHFYQVLFPDGRSYQFTDYEMLRAFWFQTMNTTGAVVSVMDMCQYE